MERKIHILKIESILPKQPRYEYIFQSFTLSKKMINPMILYFYHDYMKESTKHRDFGLITYLFFSSKNWPESPAWKWAKYKF